MWLKAGYHDGNTQPQWQPLTAGAWFSTWWTVCALSFAVCNGLPDPTLLGEAGTWPEDCDGKVPVNGRCMAKCNTGYGSPTVTCGGNGWETTVTGACRTKPSECDANTVTPGGGLCVLPQPTAVQHAPGGTTLIVGALPQLELGLLCYITE